MDQSNCPKFEAGCGAPLCPLDESLIGNQIWYPDEEICKRKDFQNLDWVKKQKAIAKGKAPQDRYFTIPMLQAIKQVRKGIEGINPDQPLKQAEEGERKWIAQKKSGQVIAEQNDKVGRVVAKKKDNLVFATSISHQDKGGENDR